jgi:hypothetical protein
MKFYFMIIYVYFSVIKFLSWAGRVAQVEGPESTAKKPS